MQRRRWTTVKPVSAEHKIYLKRLGGFEIEAAEHFRVLWDWLAQVLQASGLLVYSPARPGTGLRHVSLMIDGSIIERRWSETADGRTSWRTLGSYTMQCILLHHISELGLPCRAAQSIRSLFVCYTTSILHSPQDASCQSCTSVCG